MNTPSASHPEVTASPTPHLLDKIRSVRASIGDGLNDDELTRLLRRTALPCEAGFVFLSYSEGVVTLTVPHQETADWYPEQGWIRPEKERAGRAVAQKHGFSLAEPPDQSTPLFSSTDEAALTHHHLELSNEVETVVVVHPQYLKVRLFGAAPTARYLWQAKTPVSLNPELLQDLAALYPA